MIRNRLVSKLCKFEDESNDHAETISTKVKNGMELENREDNNKQEKKGFLNKFKRNKLVSGLVLCLFVIIVVQVYLIRPKVSRRNVRCGLGHETYDFDSESVLGNYTKFAVAVDSAFCSTVGKEILLKNGSAVDAMIAAALCNGIANCQSAGIGGGSFMLFYLKEKNKVYAIDAREVAPMSSSRDMFLNASSLYGGLATGIPGEIYGYWEAHKLGGRLAWKELFEPAIRMCKDGFRVSEILGSSMKPFEKHIRNNPGLTEIFIDPLTNQLYNKNDLIKMPKLARTLEIISETNINEFYKGNLTRVIVEEINQNGGRVTVDDFRSYSAIVKRPIEMRLDNELRIFTQPPPSGGVLVAFIMKLMRGFDFDKSTFENAATQSLFYHRLVESFKHAYSIRGLLGDEKFEDMTTILAKLNNESFIDAIRAEINSAQTFPSDFYGKIVSAEDKGTTHLSVLADGDAAALSSTVNIYFGAKYVGDTTGIIYNNQMDDFSNPDRVNYFNLKPAEANFIKPGKRPMSSMSPVIIVDKAGDVRLVLGASGGSKIISAVSQIAIKNLWMEKNIKAAIDEPRIHHQLYPAYVEAEESFYSKSLDLLSKYGHEVRCYWQGGSVVQAIAFYPEKNLIEANCDFRKGGRPDGL